MRLAPTLASPPPPRRPRQVEKKISGLKTLISLTLNGEVMPKLLMTVIRFCVTSDNHMIKKLMLIYWEVIDKTGPDGKLLPEMILVCNSLRNDLSHANEYIRGCTLRFLTKLKEPEILEPLIPTIKNNLEHRHSFVRRNAVLAVFAIYRSFEELLPDGPQLVEKVRRGVASPPPPPPPAPRAHAVPQAPGGSPDARASRSGPRVASCAAIAASGAPPSPARLPSPRLSRTPPPRLSPLPSPCFPPTRLQVVMPLPLGAYTPPCFPPTRLLRRRRCSRRRPTCRASATPS